MATRTKINVYDLKQAERFNGKFDKDMSVLVDVKKVSKAYADKHNKSFKTTGSFFVLNEEKNEAYQKAVIEKAGEVESKEKSE